MPKRLMIVFLSLIAISAMIFKRDITYLAVIVLAIASTYISDSIFIRIRKIEPFPLYASLVTGLIIGLVTAPTLPIYFAPLAATIGMAGKNFIRANNRHIFNPAGLGVLSVSLIFGKEISWWGVTWQRLNFDVISILTLVILLGPAVVSVFIMRRYKIVFSFLIVYFLTLLLIFHIGIRFDPTVLFFSIVMLPEPMTTPNYPVRQLFFGPFVAIGALIGGSLIGGLLAGNLIFYSFNLFINRLRINK